MQFSDDRLLRLSGLSTRDDYRQTILKESVGDGLDDEARLREAIRKEVRAVIEEVLAEREASQIEKARQTKSVAASLGYGAHGSETTRRPNRATSRGPAGMKGFGGPGFM